MQLIQTVTVGSGGAASISFTSIPQTFTDLYVLISARGASSSDFPAVGLKLNSATTNYSTRYLLGSGSSTASGTTANTYLRIGNASGSSQTASTFANASAYIPNYTSSTSKSISADTVSENNATAAYQNIVAALWTGTDPITQLDVIIDGFNLVQYSSASLYGILKGSDGIVTVS